MMKCNRDPAYSSSYPKKDSIGIDTIIYYYYIYLIVVWKDCFKIVKVIQSLSLRLPEGPQGGLKVIIDSWLLLEKNEIDYIQG